MAQTSLQDPWGRSPGDPEYNQPPSQTGTPQGSQVTPDPNAGPDIWTNTASTSTGSTGTNQGYTPPSTPYGYDPNAPPPDPNFKPYNSYDPSTWPNAPPPGPNTPLPHTGPGPTSPGTGPPITIPKTPGVPQVPFPPPAPPAAPTTPTTPTTTPTSTDYSKLQTGESIRDWVIRAAKGIGRDDIANDPGAVDYWVSAINSKPLTGNDMGYWLGRLKQPDNGNSGLTSPTGGTGGLPATVGLGTSTTAPDLSGVGSVPPINTPASDDLTQALWARARQSLQINPNDPIIQNQTSAYSSEMQTAARNALSQAAEHAGPGGNISAETRAAGEQTAQGTAGFQAALMQQELTARRKEIQDALNGLQGYLTDQQKMALQEQLAQMDNALQYARLKEQGYEFAGNLGYQYANLGQNAYQFDANRADKLFAGA